MFRRIARAITRRWHASPKTRARIAGLHSDLDAYQRRDVYQVNQTDYLRDYIDRFCTEHVQANLAVRMIKGDLPAFALAVKIGKSSESIKTIRYERSIELLVRVYESPDLRLPPHVLADRLLMEMDRNLMVRLISERKGLPVPRGVKLPVFHQHIETARAAGPDSIPAARCREEETRSDIKSDATCSRD